MSFSRIDNKTIECKVRLPLSSVLSEASAAAPQQRPKLIVALDNSGSMAGSAFREALTAVKTLILETDLSATVFTFSSDAKKYEITPATAASLDRLHANGGTCFSAIFNAISEELRSSFVRDGDRVQIVFLTDGEDTSGREKESALSSLSSLMASYVTTRSIECSIHAIGFTPDHDVGLLSRLITASPTAGTFQYSKDREALRGCLDVIIGILSGNMSSLKATSFLQLPSESTPRKVALTLSVTEEEIRAAESGESAAAASSSSAMEVESQRFVTGTFLVNAEPVDGVDESLLSIPLTLTITPPSVGAGSSTMAEAVSIPLSLSHVALSHDEKMACRVSILDGKIRAAMQEAVQTQARHASRQATDAVTRSEFERLNELIRQLDGAVDFLQAESLASKRTGGRKTLMKSCLDMKTMTKGLFEMLSSLLSSSRGGAVLDTDRIAKLLALSYSNITSAAKSKALAKRVTGNVQAAEDNETAISKAAASIALNESQVTDGSLEAFYCPMSLQNWLEAAKGGDCICLGLTVSRSEAAISDPSQIRVQSISSTYVSAFTFLDALEFSSSQDSEDWSLEVNSVHGGFDRKASAASSVMEGVARERINSILPLYISDEHWKVARLQCKPVLGYLATLSVLGFTQAQVETIPFIALMKLAQETLLPAAPASAGNEERSAPSSVSEFKLRQLHALLRTCAVILRRFPCGENLKKLLQTYVADPSLRLPQSFASNTVLLGQLFCAIVTARSTPLAADGTSDPSDILSDEIFASWESILPRILDEEIRRNCAGKMEQMASAESVDEETLVSGFLRSLLNLDVNSMIEVKFGEAGSSSNSMYGPIISRALAQLKRIDAERIAELQRKDAEEARQKAGKINAPGEGKHKSRSKRKALELAARNGSTSSSAAAPVVEASVSAFDEESEARGRRQRVEEEQLPQQLSAASMEDDSAPLWQVVVKPFDGQVDAEAEPCRSALQKLMKFKGGFFNTVTLFSTFGRLALLSTIFKKYNHDVVLSSEAVVELKAAAESDMPRLSSNLAAIAPSIAAPTRLAMVAQGLKQRKNADRKLAIESGKYHDVVDAPLAALSAIGNAELEEAKKKQEAQMQNSALQTAITLFCSTEDLEEAAGILRKEAGRVSSPSFAAFKKAVQTHGRCKRVVEKIRLLLSGSYIPQEEAASSLAVPLLTKSLMTPQTATFRGWLPSSTNIRALVASNRDQATEDQFVELFTSTCGPQVEQYVRSAYRGVQTLNPRPLPASVPRRNAQ